MYDILFCRFSLVLIALCALPQRINFTFLGWFLFHIVFASVGYFYFFPYVHHFVRKRRLMLGRYVNEFASLDNPIGARSRLNSAHYVALLSFRFLPSFKSQKWLTSFDVSLIVAVLLCSKKLSKNFTF